MMGGSLRLRPWPCWAEKYAKFFILRGLTRWGTLGLQAVFSDPPAEKRFQIPEVTSCEEAFLRK